MRPVLVRRMRFARLIWLSWSVYDSVVMNGCDTVWFAILNLELMYRQVAGAFLITRA